ncbi:MAG: 1-acyl-sn-glycerol-3-phosphate acyltransferase [Planctomycetes bacterium]|nr:1-acyl-sn-glycerol-3-phosphate acyltransferase [Planctomycetota bacterium]
MKEFEYEPSADMGLTPRERLQSVHREAGLVATFMHRLWWAFVRVYLRVWHRARVEGRENLPTQVPFVLIANHTSHLDTMLLAAYMPGRLRDKVFPIAAGDTFFAKTWTSIFAALCLNALPVWRKKVGSHALSALRERLVDECCGYILFPEGTRTRDGKLTKFKPGLGMLLAGTDVPVIPCHLDGAFEALPAGKRFPRPRRLVLRVGKPIQFADIANERTGWNHVAETTQSAVSELGVPFTSAAT